MADNDIDDWEDVPLEDDWEDVGERAPADEGPGMLEAGLRGAAQGITMGGGEEVSSYLASRLGVQEPRTVGRGIDAPLDPRSGYEVERDIMREENRAAQEAHGGAYLAGELGGALLTAPITGGAAGGLVKAAAPRLGGKAALGAAGVLEGLGTGAAEGFGRSEAEDTGELLQDIGTGAGIGALLPAALSGAGAAGRAGVQRFAGDPAERAANSARAKLAQAGKTPTEISKLERRGKLQRTSEDIRELAQRGGEGVFPQTSSGLLGSMQEGLEGAADEMNAINRMAAESGAVVDTKRVAAEIRQLATPYQGMAGGEKVISDIDNIATKLESMSGMDMVIAQKQRKLLNDSLALESPLTHGEVGRQIYGAFRGGMQDAITAVSDPATAQKWSDLNRLVSSGIKGAETASRKAGREAAHVIPTTFGALGALSGLSPSVGMVGGGMTGLAVGGAAKLVRDRSGGIKSAYHRGLGGIAEGGVPPLPGSFKGTTTGEGLDLLSAATSRTMAGAAIPTAQERRDDLISMASQQSQSPAVQQSAQAIEQASQTPGTSGAVEYFKQIQTNEELRKELENDNGRPGR